MKPPFFLHQKEELEEPEEEIDTKDRIFVPEVGNKERLTFLGTPHTPYLYIERKPRRMYQFPSRPSPGDLKRIASGSLTVVGFNNGQFFLVTPSGTTPVDSYEDAHS